MNSYARTNDYRSGIWVEIKLTHLALWICLHDVIARVSARIMWLMFYARCGKSSIALCAWYPTNLFYTFSTGRVRRNVLVHSCEFQINLSGMFSIDAHIRATYKYHIKYLKYLFRIKSQMRELFFHFLHVEHFIYMNLDTTSAHIRLVHIIINQSTVMQSCARIFEVTWNAHALVNVTSKHAISPFFPRGNFPRDGNKSLITSEVRRCARGE